MENNYPISSLGFIHNKSDRIGFHPKKEAPSSSNGSKGLIGSPTKEMVFPVVTIEGGKIPATIFLRFDVFSQPVALPKFEEGTLTKTNYSKKDRW